MIVVFGVFLLTLLLITAFAIVRATNLFVAVMLSGIFSLLMALNFFLLDAADVALTEAAVGAGISTVLFLGALMLTTDRETSQSSNRLVGLIVSFVTIAAVIYGTFDQPRFADPNAPIQMHVAPYYLETTRTDIDIPNVVTAVLASFRGYDTLGEVLVVYVAGLGVLFLLGQYSGRREQRIIDCDADEETLGLRHYLIPRMVGRMLIPFILLFGLYVQFHGDFGPGGGFQAGAIIAASLILFALLEGEDRALQVLPKRVLTWLMAGGALLYGGVGVACMLMGGNFLDYNVLADNPITGQHIGIIVIEAGVGLTVTGVMLSIFHAFAARGRF